MHTRFHLLLALTLTALFGTTLAACGSSGGSAVATQASSTDTSAVVAQVGDTSITRATLSHWMSTLLGGDYSENLGGPAPRGLVSDPPNYPACIAAIGTIAPPRNASETPKQLESKCQALYQAVKQQALSYLINGLWIFQEAGEHGIHVSDQEVQRYFEKVKAERYPSEAAFKAFLAGREWSLSDEMYLLKRDLYMTRLNAMREKTARKTASGGEQAVQRAAIELYEQATKRWAKKTECRAGYVIPECKQYKGSATNAAESSGPSPDVLLEDIMATRKI